MIEVYENIVTNAIRYATNKVVIFINSMNHTLQLCISDDGKGFKDGDIELVTKAYYHDNPADDLSH